MDKYRNSIFDYTLGDAIYSNKKHEEEIARLALLEKIANKPATSNLLIYLIPLGALVVFGVVFFIVLKKKKSA